MSNKYTLVWGDDWEGFYIDGELQVEGHKVTVEDVLEFIGITYDVVYPDQSWLEEEGNLPRRLKAVQKVIPY